MDLAKSSLFLSGLLVGSFLDTKTTLILLTIAVIIENKPLPVIVGGYAPQDIVSSLMIKLGKNVNNILQNAKNDKN